MLHRWSVRWAEGTPLMPELFLSADRHLARQIDEAEGWARPFGWGVRELELQVGPGQAVLQRCQARFKDGTKLSIPDDVAPGGLRADLNGALRPPAATAMLYLTLPADPSDRYESRMQEVSDGEGADPVDIEFRRPRFELRAVAEGDDLSAYIALPLARLIRSGRPGGEPEIDPTFVPPLLAYDAWPPLVERLRQLAGLIHARALRLAGQRSGRPLAIDPRLPDDLPRLLKLHALNGVDAFLQAVVETPRLAPWDLHVGLARAAGEVALFTPDRFIADLPNYVHEAPGAGFAELIRLIELALGEEEVASYETYGLRREANGRLGVDFQPSWRRERRPILLGVTTRLAPAACEQLLLNLDIAIAGRDKVEQLYTLKIHGIDIRRPATPPPGTPTAAGQVFFEFVENEKHFRDVELSRSLAIMVNPERVRFLDERLIAAGDSADELRFDLLVFNPPR